jgi:hypothetical protein
MNVSEMELEIYPDDIETFFPLAEMYMGIRAKEVPLRKRTLHLKNTSNVALKSKKQKVKKKNRKK